jgi:hypothetical protein
MNDLGDPEWARVLAGYVAQLSPDFVVQVPLPHSVFTDQIGARRALSTAELLDGVRCQETQPSPRCAIRFTAISSSCAEASLQAADVANSLDISTQTLHRIWPLGRRQWWWPVGQDEWRYTGVPVPWVLRNAASTTAMLKRGLLHRRVSQVVWSQATQIKQEKMSRSAPSLAVNPDAPSTLLRSLHWRERRGSRRRYVDAPVILYRRSHERHFDDGSWRM